MDSLIVPVPPRLADRLGMTVHESPLRFHLLALQRRHPGSEGDGLEDWLLEVANQRGADVVSRHPGEVLPLCLPGNGELSDEELVGGLCLLQSRDRPHLLRPAAQLISRGRLDCRRLIRLAKRERLEAVLGPMARAALRIEPRHRHWRFLARCFPQSPPRKGEPVIHWTRLSEPVFSAGSPAPAGWRLVA